MKTMARSVTEDALLELTAAVQGHPEGGEIRARLQADWSDCGAVPTIVVRIGHHVTMRQAPTYREAAEVLLGWVGRIAPAVITSPLLMTRAGRPRGPRQL